MPDATFACPDLTTFCRLDELGLEVLGQRLEPDRAVLACRVVDGDQWCRRCGCEGSPRDSVTRRLAHEPLGWRPTTLLITIRRYRCTGCGHVWRQDTSRAAEPRAKLSRRALRWALEGIVCQHLTVARVAEGLGVSWNTANDAVLAEGRRVLIEDPHRFDGVRVAGDALDQCRRRIQQATYGHRGRKGDPLYAARRTLHTGAALLTDKQRQRLTALFTDDEHAGVEATWGIYQHMIAAYREPDRKRGRELMQQLIGAISHSVPTVLREVITLGRTLKRRAVEHLRGSALGFRNLTNYIARSLLETGGFRPRLRPRS